MGLLPLSLILTTTLQGIGRSWKPKGPSQTLLPFKTWKMKDKKVTVCELNINPSQSITEMWTVMEGGREGLQNWRPWL